MGGISTRVDTDYSYLLKKDVKKEVVETVKKEEPAVLGNVAPAEPVNQEEVFEVPTVQLADQDAPAEGQSFSAATVEFGESSDVEADEDPVEVDKDPTVLEDPVLGEGTGIQTATEEPKEEKKGKGKPGRKKKN